MLKLSRYSRMRLRASLAGNTLAEYALPLALVVVSSGVILGFVNAGNLLPNFLAKSGGGSVSGATVISPTFGSSVNGPLGTGAGFAGGGTYIAGGGGGFFFGGGSYAGNGATAPETNGGPGTGWTLGMPAVPANHRQGGSLPPGDSVHYVPSVNNSVDTGNQMARSDAMARALVTMKYADSARVQVAVMQNPDEVEANGGWEGLAYGDAAREDQINAGVEGDASGIAEDVQQEAESIKGDADASIEAWAMSNAMMEMHTIPQESDGSGTLNPGEYEKWVDNKVVQLQKELMSQWTPPEEGAEGN